MFEQYEDVLTVEEVAEALRVGKNAVYGLLNDGGIKGFKIGKVWKISKHSLLAYIKGQSV